MSALDSLTGLGTSTVQNFLDNLSSGFNSGASSSSNKTSSLVTPDYIVTITCDQLGISLTANLPESFSFDIHSEYSAPWAEGAENMSANVSAAARAAGYSLTTQALTAQLWKGSSEVEFALPLVFQAEVDEDEEILLPLMQLMYLTLPREGTGGILASPGPSINFVNTNSGANGTSVGNKKEAGQQVEGVPPSVANVVGDGLSSMFVNSANSLGLGKLVSPEMQAKANKSSPESFMRSLTKSVKNRIQVKIGKFLLFDSVVITSVQQTHRVQPVARNGVSTGNYQRCEVNVTFKTFFTPTQLDLVNMFPSSKLGRQKIQNLINGVGASQCGPDTEWKG